MILVDTECRKSIQTNMCSSNNTLIAADYWTTVQGDRTTYITDLVIYNPGKYINEQLIKYSDNFAINNCANASYYFMATQQLPRK